MVSLVPDALQFRSNAEQFFVLALEIFRQLDDESKAVLPLSSYVKEWSKLLFEYHHEEVRVRSHTPVFPVTDNI